MQQSEQLTKFYKSYLRWIETGENPYDFSDSAGLCHNAIIFGGGVVDEMKLQFKDAGLHYSYPFNDGSPDGYEWEVYKNQNPARIEWVKNHA